MHEQNSWNKVIKNNSLQQGWWRMRLKGIGAVQKHVGTGTDPEFLCEGGKASIRGGAYIIMVWAWLRNIARKRGRCIWGLGRSPSRFLPLVAMKLGEGGRGGGGGGGGKPPPPPPPPPVSATEEQGY